MVKRRKFRELPGFDSGVSRERIGHFKFDKFETGEDTNVHVAFFRLVIILVVMVFLTRLFVLTVVLGKKNRTLAETNRIRLVNMEAERGKILSRDGQVLAQTKNKYVLKKGVDETEISESVARELEDKNLAGENFEGELGQIIVKTERYYALGEVASHAVGYVGPVSSQDLVDNANLVPSDSVGRLGIEAAYQNFLAGENGKRLVEVDALGKKISVLGKTDPKAGQDIILTVDAPLQKVSFEALKKQAEKAGSKKGAVIITNPNTGEILTLVSLPAFDPVNVGQAIVSEDRPLFDRATAGTYPPGSVFKIVTALAGLESGKINRDTEIEDVGEFELGGAKFSNWFYNQYGGRDGFLKIDRAIARSNDIFFFRLAERTGLEAIRQMAIKFGFGQKTGIDLSDEGLGLVPDEVWKKAAFKEGWFTGDTLHLGIGQGFLLATPIQINSMTAYMAGGKLLKPHLALEIKSESGKVKIGDKVLASNLVSADNFNLVREGMRQACQKGGTGWPFFEAPYIVGCKTGTAEKFEGNPHAWFTAFAPFDRPRIAITVLVEDGGEGSSVAGPVAREILDWYFKNR